MLTLQYISRVSDQNGVSPLYIMLEIRHSGREPSICNCSRKILFCNQITVKAIDTDHECFTNVEKKEVMK